MNPNDHILARRAGRRRTVKTAEQVRAEFARAGVSVASWAREHGVHPSTVRNVLGGRAAVRGDSHRVAVLLGLKHGRIDLTAADLVATRGRS